MLNLQTDALVVTLTEQLNAVRAKLLAAEQDSIEAKAKNNTTDAQGARLKRELQNATDQNATLLKEIQEVTKRKDKLELQFGRLDQIERDFERALKKNADLEELVKAKNE